MTAPTEDLIARLNEQFGDPETGGFEYVNPDGPAAATALRALQQEVERLRSGLNKISEGGPDIGPVGKPTYTHGFDQGCAWAGRVARSALTGSAQG